MSFYIEKTTKCLICGKPIESFKEAVLLPYIISDKSSSLLPFVKKYVHRKCFDNWNKRDEFAQSAFKLGENMIREGHYENVIYYDKYFIIDYQKKENFYKVRDFLLIFEILINKEQAENAVNFFKKVYLGDNSKLEHGNIVFNSQGKDILIIDYDKDEINDEIIIPHFRINDYITALDKIVKHNENNNREY
ncbi:hypothetical protein [Chryseobacterium taeanense]|uniref:hypothetical protein n=1 Tax=Chryseobacterium taeanense TaxID=311334 RepID=UPI0035B494F9